MAARSQVETKRIRYLLGLSSQAERERIESEYFEDEDAFQDMLTAEDDLMDAYARGELTGEERQRFEKHFLTSLRGRDRVQFARALAGAASGARPLETSLPSTLLDIFKTFRRWRGALRIATITAAIVLVVVLSWLFIERRRMGTELRELRAEYSKLSQQAEALRRSANAEQTRTAKTTPQLENLQVHSDKSRQRKRGPTDTQRPSHLPIPKVKNSPQKMADRRPEHEVESTINTAGATLGNSIAPRAIAQLPLDRRNVASLLTLTPGISGITALPSLLPRSTRSGGRTTITVSSSLASIKFRLGLETPAQHPEYRAAIETADGRPVISVYWAETLRPNLNSIDTPEITIVDVPSGDYGLLLTGKEPDGSFVRVAEYFFRVIRN